MEVRSAAVIRQSKKTHVPLTKCPNIARRKRKELTNPQNTFGRS